MTAARRGQASVRDEFDVRFYRWALRDARRELKAGFPLLRRIRSRTVLGFLAYATSLPRARRSRLVVALVKRWHENAARLTGDRLSADEAALVDGLLDVDLDAVLPGEEEYVKWRVKDPSRVRVDRTRLLARVQAAVDPVLGGSGRPLHGSAHLWLWETPIGPWTLRTSVDVGGRTFQLRYWHTLGAFGSQPSLLSPGTAIAGWLGIEGDYTEWDRLTEAEAADAAAHLARLCQHFLTAASRLVEGLSPERPPGP